MGKGRYIWINGENIPVSEDLYRAYYQPMWRESKREITRANKEYSYEQILENGYDVQADCLVEDIVAHKLLLDNLHEALDKLTQEERALIDALYFQEKSERKVAKIVGVSQNTVNYHKNILLKRLRQMIQKYF